MKIHVVATGTELLIGHTLNTNLQFIGRTLDEAGYAVARETCVPDTAAEIAMAVREALAAGAGLVITTGGLGPTSDDLTRDAVARELGSALHFDEELHAAIVRYLGERAAKIPADSLRAQAFVPDCAVALPNRNGTAPGLWCAAPGGKWVVMLPGPPRELQPMFAESVLPRIREMAPPEVRRRAVTVCGIAESAVAERVESLLAVQDMAETVQPAYCARLFQVDVRLSAAADQVEALDAAIVAVRREFGPAVLPDDAPSLAAAVGNLLQKKKMWLATAESCTGGWIAKSITDLPGASAFFCGSLVTYSNAWKGNLLDVSDAVLEQHGAVSAECATEMIGALFRRYEADAGIAVTGIAGPAGGSEAKPVGLVYIATGIRRQLRVERHFFPGDRESVRQRAVIAALNQLRLQLLGVG
jgi:nicotinamide-nucleotide amidase